MLLRIIELFLNSVTYNSRPSVHNLSNRNKKKESGQFTPLLLCAFRLFADARYVAILSNLPPATRHSYCTNKAENLALLVERINYADFDMKHQDEARVLLVFRSLNVVFLI